MGKEERDLTVHFLREKGAIPCRFMVNPPERGGNDEATGSRLATLTDRKRNQLVRVRVSIKPGQGAFV